MQLQQLRYFITAGRFLNFSNAARFHMIPQSAISKTIASLEKELDVQLFSRENRTVRLTPEGSFFLERASVAMNILDDAVNTLQTDGHSQLIRIGISAGTELFTDIILAFSKQYPDFRFTIIEQYPNIVDPNSFDVVFGNEMVLTPHLEGKALFHEHFALCVPEDHELADRTEISLIEAAKYPHIGFLPTFRYRKNIDQICARYGTEIKPIIEMDTGRTIVNFVDRGFGVAIIPMKTWTDDTHDKRVKLIPIIESELHQNMYIYWKKNTNISEDLKAFIDFSIEQCKKY